MTRVSVYSFGQDSPIKFEIPDKMAEAYNAAANEWFKAQVRFKNKFGRSWDPLTDPIKVNWNRRERKAWNAFAKVFNDVIASDGPFHENDIMEDFLVKNSTVAVAAGLLWSRIIGGAAAVGAVTELLRGL